jgi:hypothetical protein
LSKPYFAFLIVFIATFAFLFRSRHTENDAKSVRILAEKVYKQGDGETKNKFPEIVLKGSDLYFFGNKDVRNCHIKSEESQIFPKDKKSVCKNVTCKITTNKNMVATLKAPKVYIQEETIFLKGGVSSVFNN